MKAKKLLQTTVICALLISGNAYATGGKQPPPVENKPVVVDWFSTIIGPLNLF